VGTRAALYLRVSREDLALANQLPELHALAARRGLTIAHVYEETASAAKARPTHARMLEDAHRGAFDVVLVWSLDRFGRSMVGNVQDVLALERAGVQLVSVKEPWLDTGGPVRDLLLAIFSWVAEQERRRLIERTKAGQARARAEGKRIGRPLRVTRDVIQAAARMKAEGRTERAIAAALKLPRTSVQKALRLSKETPCPPEPRS